MDNASIIATFPAELREEVLLSADETVLATLPPALLAEARVLRERHMSRYRREAASAAAATAAAGGGADDDPRQAILANAGAGDPSGAASFSRQLRSMLGLSGPSGGFGGGGRGGGPGGRGGTGVEAMRAGAYTRHISAQLALFLSTV
jgi:E3 ubiquitin-protein ligase HUWE1